MKYDECRVILACNLFEYRAINGLSQEDLALQIGIEVKTYARIERAEGHTNLKILDRISILPAVHCKDSRGFQSISRRPKASGLTDISGTDIIKIKRRCRQTVSPNKEEK